MQRTIPGTGMLRANVTSLFDTTSVDGWLLVTATGGNIAGLVTYTDLQAGGTAAVEMQAQPADTSLVFGHIADLNPWWTGVALVNPSDVASQVEVYAIDSAGNLIGGPGQNSAASFTIAAQSKKTFLLSDVVPATQTRTTDGGYVYVRSTNGVATLRHGIVFSAQRRCVRERSCDIACRYDIFSTDYIVHQRHPGFSRPVVRDRSGRKHTAISCCRYRHVEQFRDVERE